LRLGSDLKKEERKTKQETMFLPTVMSKWTSLTAIIVLTLGFSDAQPISGDLCACNPRVYNFRLDLEQFCPPCDIAANAGVINCNCNVRDAQGNNVTDTQAILASTITMRELDQNLLPQNSFTVRGNKFSGFTWQYRSVTNEGFDYLQQNPDQIPRGLEMTITGQTEQGEQITNFWGLLYSNDCNIFPLIEGDSIGWVRFVSTKLISYTLF